jgi:phosphate transport system ATP-binding protein
MNALKTAVPVPTFMQNIDSHPAVSDTTAYKIEARQVDFFYGDFRALHNINLQVVPRQVTALIGPSGCGKSTFLRAINRMNDIIPEARLTGTITIDGENIYAPEVDAVELRRQVGMVFQRPNPFPKSIFDNVAYGVRLQGENSSAKLSEIVEQSLRQAALWEEVKDKLRQSALALSGGQQQRLCIARALAVNPDILLMDEPTSALDPNATFRIEQLIEELQNSYTIVIVTHNMQQAARVSKQVAFFLHGELVEYSSTLQLFSKPADSRTEDYIQGRFG